MVNWKNIKLVYGNNTLEHITKHKVGLSEVHNVLDGYFIPHRINISVILEPAGTNEMRLITAFDASESKKKLYRRKSKSD